MPKLHPIPGCCAQKLTAEITKAIAAKLEAITMIFIFLSSLKLYLQSITTAKQTEPIFFMPPLDSKRNRRVRSLDRWRVLVYKQGESPMLPAD